MAGAFSGIRILDFTQGVAGPMAAMLLADMDADVLKVEPPGGDRLRDHPGYLCWNRNKRITTLDLATYGGLREARRLLAVADVAVFDARPGELERLGLDASTLLRDNPRLLHAWLPPYGTEGRWSQLEHDELLLGAVSGIAFMQMSFEEQPVALVTPQISYGHAVAAANAIAAGLLERAKSGTGQAVRISGLNGMAAIETGGAVNAAGVIRMSRGSLGGSPNYRLYQCADGEWFFLGTLTMPFFIKALEAIDRLDLLALEGVDGEIGNMLKPEVAANVMQHLEARFREKPREEWLRILHENGVPRGPVGVREDWFRAETVATNEMRLEFDHPVHGRVELPGVSAKLAQTPGSVRWIPGPDAQIAAADAWRDAAPTETPAASGPPIPVGPPEDPRGPLAGVRVLDLGAFIAGTYAPTFLANFGADVVKVEPTTGDPFRAYGLGFIGYNLGKRSLAIDLKTAAGREVFLELVRNSDVVLDNFRMGVRERLGIDYASLAAVNPRIITCSVTGYGPVGPLSADPGFDPLLQARSGMMAAQGGDDEPVFHQIPVNDTATALMSAFAILTALHTRERTGRGQEVYTSLANQTVMFQSGELTTYPGAPTPPRGGRDFLGLNALRRFYRCADGWIAIGATQPAHFHGLANALEHTEWAGRIVAETALAAPGDGELAAQIAAAIAPLTRADALDRLLTQQVPAAPATDRFEMFEPGFLRDNGMFQETVDPGLGPITTVRAYAEWGRSRTGFELPAAPAMGEHSRAILADFGFAEKQIDALIEEGTVAQH